MNMRMLEDAIVEGQQGRLYTGVTASDIEFAIERRFFKPAIAMGVLDDVATIVEVSRNIDGEVIELVIRDERDGRDLRAAVLGGAPPFVRSVRTGPRVSADAFLFHGLAASRAFEAHLALEPSPFGVSAVDRWVFLLPFSVLQ